MKICISSGHGKHIRGAAGPSPWGLDEVNEARKVVEETAKILRNMGVEVITYHDDTSDDQSENLNRIVDYHNSKSRDLDVSVHFNAYQVTTTKLMGCEVLYASSAGQDVAEVVVDAICDAVPWPNRGPKHRGDLMFLNQTSETAILIETCFVDSKPDADMYRRDFAKVCQAIAEGISGEQAVEPIPPEPEPPEPPVVPPRPPPGPEVAHRTLSKGDSGDDVAAMQRVIGVPSDGDFGSITHEQVQAFQAASGLTADGVVGPLTWSEIDSLQMRMREGETGLSERLTHDIIDLAEASPLMEYKWRDRGPSPPGYLPGMACSFAVALMRLEDGDAAATVMAEAAGNADVDALAWYASEFKAIGLPINKAGRDALIALFTLMIGLGMRETSGEYYCGRDMSADNVAADTCEAGLFQSSWNLATCHPTMGGLLDEFWEDPNGFHRIFREGLAPNASDLDCYGKGEGATYQWLAKYCPLFAVLTTAVGLRKRRAHWGPIGRREVELRPDAAQLLRDVAAMLTEPPTS